LHIRIPKLFPTLTPDPITNFLSLQLLQQIAMFPPLLPRFLPLLLLPSFSIAQASPTVSLANSPEYTALRNCAQCCLVYCFVNFSPANLIQDKLGCANNLNSCLCRADLIPQGVSYLSSCVYSACTSDITDVASAVAVYTDYSSNTDEPFVAGVTTTPGTASGAVATGTLGGGGATTQYIPLTGPVTVTETKVLAGVTGRFAFQPPYQNRTPLQVAKQQRLLDNNINSYSRIVVENST